MTLRLVNASLHRQGTPILAQADMLLRSGTFTAICGPNGAGKSTALGALAGSLPLESGRAELDGQPVNSYAPRALARRRAVLPQTPALAFPFLVHEVVAMGRAPHDRRDPREDAAIVTEAMALAAVLDLAERNYLTLSGGERQRVQLARVLAQVWTVPEDGGARWLLLDEPVSALDLKHQLGVMRLLQRLAREGWGVLAILHDLPMVARHCDAVALMMNGTVLSQGPPGDILTPEKIAYAFDVTNDDAAVLMPA